MDITDTDGVTTQGWRRSNSQAGRESDDPGCHQPQGAGDPLVSSPKAGTPPFQC